MAKSLKETTMEKKILEHFKSIRTLIFDVDGVLTDGSLIITEKGELLRTMNAKDGMAMRIAVLSKKYQLIIITGGNSQGVITRLKGLGIKEVHGAVYDKLAKLEELEMEYDWNRENVLYMGDDLNDEEIMTKIGLPVCPANAAHEIKEIAKYISPLDGGKGCVRDVIEKVLKLNGDWKHPENF